MAVVAIDTSGQIVRNPDVWIVAIRKQNQIQHTGIHINQDVQNEFRNISKNWVDKLYATLFFKTSNTLLRSHDIIQIDKDFQGKRAAHVRHYMECLFGTFNLGSERTKPTIQFLLMKYSEPVRDAHNHTQFARHGSIEVSKNPNVKKEFDCLTRLT